MISLCREFDPDLILLDLHMPGMSGQELQRHLRSSARSIPMIFITAFPDKKTRDRVLAAGALAFFEKPFDCKQLLGVLGKASARESDGTQD